MTRLLKFVAVAICCLLAGLLLTGIVYEQIGEHRDHEWPPRVGTAYDVGGGRTMNLSCMGDGSPTVILENGAGGPGIEWADVQPQLAKISRTCWYDRAGIGWSERNDNLRTGDNVATDLHALLTAANIPPPYVMVGQSIGGMYIRVFTGKYPGEVTGLVFVDSSQEDQLRYEPKSHAGLADRMKPWQVKTIVFLSPFLYHAGILRLLLNRFGPRIPADANSREATITALKNRPSALYASMRGGKVWNYLPAEVK